jgi:hypothetical protein
VLRGKRLTARRSSWSGSEQQHRLVSTVKARVHALPHSRQLPRLPMPKCDADSPVSANLPGYTYVRAWHHSV